MTVAQRADDFENALELTRYFIKGRTYTCADPQLQERLSRVYGASERPRCMCVPGGVEMYIAKHADYVVKMCIRDRSMDDRLPQLRYVADRRLHQVTQPAIEGDVDQTPCLVLPKVEHLAAGLRANIGRCPS